jgi:hypothetical protein
MMTATQTPKKKVEIDFLFIDLEVCERCKGTDSSLESALEAVSAVLESAGVQVIVSKTLVETAEQARQLGFVSSPTIRVNGRDIAIELRESSCATCGEACACEGGIDCRVWVYQGREYTVAPVAMVVDAILAAVYGGTEDDTPMPPLPQTVPANLQRFFAAKARQAAASCCSAEERQSCCEPAQKTACCSPVMEAEPAGCGCR